MGLFSKALGVIAPTSLIGNMLGASSGQNIGDAALSGIPFIGEGFAAQQQQNFAAGQSAQQMAFQKQMSDTAHQRQVADLKKAGLNPILSANSGASSPAGSAASGSMGSGAGNSANMLKSIYNKERELADQNIKRTEADTALLAEKKATEKINQTAISNSAKESEQRTKESKERTELLKYDQEGAKQDAAIEKDYGRAIRLKNHILNSAQQVKDLFDPMAILKHKEQVKQNNKPVPQKPTKKGYRRENYGPKGEHTGSTIHTDIY